MSAPVPHPRWSPDRCRSGRYHAGPVTPTVPGQDGGCDHWRCGKCGETYVPGLTRTDPQPEAG